MYKVANVRDEYNKRLITANQAAAIVKNGDRIHFGTGCGTPVDIDIALGKRAEELRGVVVLSTVAIRKQQFQAGKNSCTDNVAFTSAHFGGGDRAMSKEGRCWYMPMMFNELPYLWTNNSNDIDIAVFQVGPMDAHGNFNLGPQVSDLWGVMQASKKIIVEVNENMPRCHGYKTEVNLAQVDYVVEGTNSALAEIPSKDPSETDRKIAEHVVSRIRDNSPLQLGIGSLPNCIGQMLADSDIKGLSGHSEMLTDAYADLYAAGKLTSEKQLDPGKIVYTFAGGTKKLYDFIDDNPICACAPVDYVNSVANIAKMDNFVSVNSCIQVDLYGQVCSESAGHQQISGTGGQLDFVLGAFQSNGGQSFLCTPATRTTRDGKMESLIAPGLTPGSIVTTPRTATNYVVTEFGAANMKGKSTWERAELLIGIAHPDFRDDLIKDAEKMGIWRNCNKKF